MTRPGRRRVRTAASAGVAVIALLAIALTTTVRHSPTGRDASPTPGAEPVTAAVDHVALTRVHRLRGTADGLRPLVVHATSTQDPTTPQDPTAPPAPTTPQESASPTTATSLCDNPPRAAFRDVSDTSSAAPAIDCLVLHDIVRGVAHDRFAPGEPLRRDHVASMLARSLDAVGVSLPAIDEPRFLDVSGVHADAIERLAAAGIIAGRTATHFAPDALVRRDQLASLLARSVAVVAGVEPDGSHPFGDLEGNVHEPAIAAAVSLGLVQGTDASRYDPARTASRAQTAVALDRLLTVLLDPPLAPTRPAGWTVAHPDPAPLIRVAPIPPSLHTLMQATTWRPGCPVAPAQLRLVEVVHVDLDGTDRWGQLVVHEQVADDVAEAFATLYGQGFPIARMEPIEHFGGDDNASMAANNTSAFNCRRVTGGNRFSEHAYGWAIDINPVQNPYVRGTSVLPPAGQGFVDRSEVRPGMLTRPGAVAVFDALGWGWGGDWRSLKDYQHVSLTGR